MAITIIKGGKNEFIGHCKWCGCDFRYTDEDVVRAMDQIVCPHCKRVLEHHGEHGTSPYPGRLEWVAGQQNAAAFYAQQMQAKGK